METSPPNIARWHWHKVGAGVHLCCVDVPLLYERTGPRNLHRHVSYARRCFGLQSHEQLVCHLFHGVRCGAAAGATVEVSEHSRDNGVCAPSSRMVEVRELLHGSVCVLSYAGLQLAVALAIVKEHSASLTAGAVCAGWTVMALLLTVNLGYLGGDRAFGYLAAMVSYLVPLSYVPLMRWLVGASVSFGQPRWIAVLLVMTIALVVANYALFKRLEII